MRGLLAGLVVAAALALAPAASAATIFVDGSEPGEPGACGSAQNPCDTIQEGIDAASTGDLVQIAAGTYVEQLEIDEAITLRGDGDSTQVKSPADPVLEDKFGSGDNRPVVFVHDLAGTGATIERLRVNGFANGGNSCAYTFYGIAFLNASGAVDDLTVDHIRNQPFDGCESGFAVYNLNDDATARDWTVASSTIEDYQRAGIVAEGDLETVITGNTVTGRFAQTELVQSGIELVGAGGEVSGNVVTDNACDEASCGPDPLSDSQSGGIVLIAAADETTVSGNEAHSNDVGVVHSSVTGALTGVRTVTGNDLGDNRYGGIYTNDGTLIATENEVSGAEGGIVAASIDLDDGFVPTVSASGNTIADNVTGIRLLRDAPTTDAPTLSAAFNRIAGNAAAGLDNETDATVNAENNWWGCSAGPTDPACDSITEDEPQSVDAGPFLVMKLIKGTKSNGKRTITANLRFNSNGVKFVPTDFPDGTEVAFTASRGTIPSFGTTIDGKAVVIHRKPGSTHKATITATLDGETLQVLAR